MSYKIKGKAISYELENKNNFSKRVLWLETDKDYNQVIQIEFSGDKINENIDLNCEYEIEFFLSGRQWTNPKTGEVKVFNTLKGWRANKIESTPTHKEAAETLGIEDPTDDLPF